MLDPSKLAPPKNCKSAVEYFLGPISSEINAGDIPNINDDKVSYVCQYGEYTIDKRNRAMQFAKDEMAKLEKFADDNVRDHICIKVMNAALAAHRVHHYLAGCARSAYYMREHIEIGKGLHPLIEERIQKRMAEKESDEFVLPIPDTLALPEPRELRHKKELWEYWRETNKEIIRNCLDNVSKKYTSADYEFGAAVEDCRKSSYYTYSKMARFNKDYDAVDTIATIANYDRYPAPEPEFLDIEAMGYWDDPAGKTQMHPRLHGLRGLRLR